MESLLKLQAGLRENLLTLANNSPDFYWRIKPVKTTTTSFDMSNLMKDAEKKVKECLINSFKKFRTAVLYTVCSFRYETL